ncbi:MAG: hypothetical protein ACE5I1_02055 [bacterium]
MSAVLAKCLQDIIRKVEKASGRKIKIIEKRGMSLPVVAKVACGDMPAHLFYLDPSHQELAYHAIAHECVHILRLFGVDEDKRIVPMATPEMRALAFAAIDKDIQETSTELTDKMLKRMRGFWYDSIMRQLSNQAPDLMIEKWLYKYYPELRPIQISAIRQQAENAEGSLQQDVQNLTPPMIFEASNTMNFVYFHLLGKRLEMDLDTPYRKTHFAREGKKLARLTLKDYQDNYEGDVAMIHLWAEFLGLSDWFAWINLENAPV